MKRFKGLDLIERVPEKIWTEIHGTVQEAVIKNGFEWVNLIQMTIISTTVGKNPLEEME